VRSVLDVTERNLAKMAARKVEQYAMELRIKNEQLARALEGARSGERRQEPIPGQRLPRTAHTAQRHHSDSAKLLHDGKLGPVAPEQVEFLADILSSARHLPAN